MQMLLLTRVIFRTRSCPFNYFATLPKNSKHENSIIVEKFDVFWQKLNHNPPLKLLAESETVTRLKILRDQLAENIRDLESIVASSDPELSTIARQDVKRAEVEKADIESRILEALSTNEGVENQEGLVLSATCGVGGQESMLFTKELFTMYRNYASCKQWSFDDVDVSESDIGGYHAASAAIRGKDAFKFLRFESGVHRVQRVPVTERTGRMHTSTCSITISPTPRDIDFVIKSADLKKETFRAGGHGGQNMQMNESAVRLTHLPTKLSVESRKQRNQNANFEEALKRLRWRLYELEFEKQQEKLSTSLRLQMGQRARCEKIRTYHFTDNRVTDHRIHRSFQPCSDIMLGGEPFEQIVNALLRFNQQERIAELFRSVGL